MSWARCLAHLPLAAFLSAAPDLPVAFAGFAAQQAGNGWGCCLGLHLASSKVGLSGRMQGTLAGRLEEEEEQDLDSATWQPF